jgi:hypothetical protein
MLVTPYALLEQRSIQELGLSSQIAYIPGQTSTFFASVSLLWTLGIMVCVGAAVYTFILSGVSRLQASESGIRQSKERFKRGALGLMGVLSLFLIIDTINKDLLIGNIDLKDLRVSTGSTLQQSTNQQPINQATLPGDGQSKLATLNANNVFINHNNIPCTSSQMTESAPACTSLEGMPDETIQVIIDVSKACTLCRTITVTGGTEPGHRTHGIGKYPADLSYQTALHTFLQNNGNLVSPGKYGWRGYVFWDEQGGDRHFHIYK